MNPTKISVFNLVGNGFCVEAKEGEAVFNAIGKVLQQKKEVSISFQNVEMLTSAFLNTAIGQLYNQYSEEDIRAFVQVEGISKADSALLRRVIETAKLYYKDPTWLEESANRIMEEN